jgi:Hemerythrin HHE cation binding domain
MTKIQFRADPASSEYQISKEFQPDKEKTWSFPPENDALVLEHNSLRGEAEMMKEALQAIQQREKPVQAWEINAINQALDAHLIHMRVHQSAQEDILMPELKKRFLYPENLTKDHAGLTHTLAAIDKTFHNMKPGDVVDDNLSQWIAYQEHMIQHLAEKEEIGLPLYRAYFTPADASPIIMKIAQHNSKVGAGSVTYFSGTKNLLSFVWNIDLQLKYGLFKKVFVENLESVMAGNDPKSSLSWLSKWNRGWPKLEMSLVPDEIGFLAFYA